MLIKGLMKDIERREFATKNGPMVVHEAVLETVQPLEFMRVRITDRQGAILEEARRLLGAPVEFPVKASAYAGRLNLDAYSVPVSQLKAVPQTKVG